VKYHRITTIAGLVLGTAVLTATAANAVTFNPDGSGFIGKGEVQSAFGMNNAVIQKVVNDNHFAFTFTTKQDASQALSQALFQSGSQDGTQTGTQSGKQVISQSATQDVIETLSCTKTNGNVDQQFRIGSRDGERSDTRTATRTAERDAHRDGSRTGVRYGTRDGSLNGTLNATIDASARKTGQWTGWNVKGFSSGGSPAFSGTGSASFPEVSSLTGNYDFGAWSFEGSTWESAEEFGNFGPYDLGDYDFGPITWATTDYVAAPGNNDPDGVCKEGASNVVPGSVKTVTAYGQIHENDPEFGTVVPGDITDITGNEDVTPGDIHDGPVQPGTTTPGAVTPTGVVKTFAAYNGTTKQIG
jgi:hypothetical protein